MEFQDGFRVANLVLVILGIVASVKGESALADVAVDILDLVLPRHFRQDDHALFHLVLKERGRLPQKAVDNVRMALGEHGGHGVVFGGKVEELKVVRLRSPQAGVVAGVDIGKLVFVGICLEGEVLEREAALIVELAFILGIDAVAVDEGVHDIHPPRRQGDVEGVRAGAHGKEEAASNHKLLYLLCHGMLELPNLGIAVSGGHRLVGAHIVLIPGHVPVGAVKLAILPGEILMVQMQPVIIGQFAFQHLVIPEAVVIHLGIFQGEGYGVIPGQGVRRDIDADLGLFLQHHGLHIGVLNLQHDGGHLGGRHLLEAHPPDIAQRGDLRRVRDQEAAAPVVEQPLYHMLLLKRFKSDSIGLEVVALGQIHGDQNLSPQPGAQQQGQQQRQERDSGQSVLMYRDRYSFEFFHSVKFTFGVTKSLQTMYMCQGFSFPTDGISAREPIPNAK